MKNVITSLLLIVFLSGFIFAADSSQVRTDFYIREKGTVEEYAEENYEVNFRDWRSCAVYGTAVLVVLIVVLMILRKLKRKKTRRETSKKKVKKVRRRQT